MPYVSIQITSEPRATSEQRERLIALVTDALVVTLDKDPQTTFVVIEEVGVESWGIGGESVQSRRARTQRSTGGADDAKAVTEVIERYFAGLHDGDVELLRGVFHPEARLMGFAPANPEQSELPDRAGVRTLEEYLAVVAARQSPRERGEIMRSRMLSVQCDGPLAFVRALVPMLGYSYLDHLLLTREAGTWRIAQKHFAHGVDRYGGTSR